jgi:hypothetical protein
MRGLVLIVGIGALMASLYVVLGQAVQWHNDGVWNWVPFGVLWSALDGGESPDPTLLGPLAGPPLLWLLGRPLSLVLFGAGTCLVAICGTGQRNTTA